MPRPFAAAAPAAAAADTGDAASATSEASAHASAFEACCRALSHKANKAVVEQLPVLKSGSIVDLSRNYIGAGGLRAIAVMLPHNPNITEVLAPRNGITNDAVVLFCRAMRGHSRLALLDFSDNTDISLAGGLALLNLAQQTPTLRAIKLQGTHVPPAVLAKVSRALQFNATEKAPVHRTVEAALAMATTTLSATSAQQAATAAVVPSEAEVLQALRRRVEAALADGYELPPPSPRTGWRVLDVPILAPPLLFDTEVELLCCTVFPQLNDEFAPHRLILRPVVVGGGAGAGSGTPGVAAAGKADVAAPAGPPVAALHRTAGSYSRALHFRPASDVTAVLERARFAAIELIGDRPGDYTQLPASAMLHLQVGPDDATSEGTAQAATHAGQRANASDAQVHGEPEVLQPVLYEAHEAALRHTRWLLVATRRDTRTLQVPPALAPLLTADPIIAYPDRHRTVVRAIVIGDDEPQLSTVASNTVPATAALHVDTASTTVPFPKSLVWDYATEEYQWKRHVTWREEVVASAPVPELVVSRYPAAFECTSPDGGVRLTQLQRFESAIHDRLRTLVSVCVDFEQRRQRARTASETDAGAKSLGRLLRGIGLQRAWDMTFTQAVAAASSGAAKKNLMNRLILYAANPPSRNMLLLHGMDAASLATLMARGAARLQALEHAYSFTSYTTRSTLLHEEPTDLRSAMTHVVSQLTTNAAVLRYVQAEVDIERLSSFFLQVLSGSVVGKSAARVGRVGPAAATAVAAAMREASIPEYAAEFTLGGDAGEGDGNAGTRPPQSSTSTNSSSHAFVVLLDGLEAFTAPVRPCGALVHPPGTSGQEAGGGAEPASWFAEPAVAGRQSLLTTSITSFMSKSAGRAQPTAMEALLPRALARNVRLIASCASNSTAYSAFRHLGRDTVEMLSFGAVSANEVEQYLAPASLARVGLVFSEDEFECARGKRDAPVAEYMAYLLDAARNVHESPGFLSQAQAIEAFPDTLEEAAQGLYDRLVHAFGLPLSRYVLGLLMASRWGLLLPELRDLLPSLSTCRLQELLRLLRPALETEPPTAAVEVMGASSGNALLGAARLTAPSFIEVVQREALELAADELQTEDDQRVCHRQLALYYLAIVYRKVRLGRATGGAGAAAGHAERPDTQAVQRRAFKELIYHMTQSGDFWSQMDVTVLSLPFLEEVYAAGLGYAYLRDLTSAFNERYQRHLLGEDIGEPSWQQQQQQQQRQLHAQEEEDKFDFASADHQLGGAGVRFSITPGTGSGNRYALPTVLKRMRDYICFAHQYGLLLSLRPTLVAQVALQIPASQLNAVQRDAVRHLHRQLQDKSGGLGAGKAGGDFARVFFTAVTSASATKQPTHLRPITCAAYLPNRRFVVTASSDRSLAWVNPETGSVSWYARQPTAPVESLTVCRTSAYVAAVTEDRTLWVYDGLQGTLVTHFRGTEWFDAPIDSLVFSCRGRYLWVVTSDARVRCFACESGQLRCTLGATELLQTADGEPSEAAAEVQAQLSEWRCRRNFLHVVADDTDDEVCTTFLGAEVRQWRLLPWEESQPDADGAVQTPRQRTAEVACEMTVACTVDSIATAARARDVGVRAGYKTMERWCAGASAAPGSPLCILAAPLSEPEVQLLVVQPESGTAAVAVRFPLAAALQPFSAPATPEAVVLSASPDGQWVAVGLAGGAVNLFCISAPYNTWRRQPQSSSRAAVVCGVTSIFTSLMPTVGMSSAPLRSLAFHRAGHFLFALGHCLVCWRLPDAATAAATPPPSPADAVRSDADGEYLCPDSPACLTVLPPPTSSVGDAELPRNIAEVALGDDMGRVMLLKLWQQLI